MKDDLTVPYLEPGIYEHYKSNRYEVIGVAMSEEDLTPMVIYRPLYESRVKIWVRPYDRFVDDLEVNGRMVKRFSKVE